MVFFRGSTLNFSLSRGFHGICTYRGHLEESGGQSVNKPDRLWVEIPTNDKGTGTAQSESIHNRLNKEVRILRQLIHQCIILMNDSQRRLDFVKDNKYKVKTKF
jgi:hypothetical protein